MKKMIDKIKFEWKHNQSEFVYFVVCIAFATAFTIMLCMYLFTKSELDIMTHTLNNYDYVLGVRVHESEDPCRTFVDVYELDENAHRVDRQTTVYDYNSHCCEHNDGTISIIYEID